MSPDSLHILTKLTEHHAVLQAAMTQMNVHVFLVANYSKKMNIFKRPLDKFQINLNHLFC